jgi:rod shape determining protein RodA
MTPLFKKFLGLQWFLLLNVLLLLICSSYIIYNASSYMSETHMVNKWREQIIYGGIGLAVMFMLSFFDYKHIKWVCVPAYIVGIAGLLIVKKFGVEVNGNRAWLSIGGLSMQPSQPAIAAGILMLGYVMGELPRRWRWLRYSSVLLGFAGLLTLVPMALVASEDAGSGLIWIPVFLSMVVASQIRMRYVFTMILCGVMGLPVLYYVGLKPYQQKRLQVAYHIYHDELDKVNVKDEGWDLYNAQIAVASAGFDGKGPLSEKVPNRSSIHRTFLPAAETINDFLFSVCAEEFGFRGAFLLIMILVLLILQIMYVAMTARDHLGRILVTAVGVLFFVHIYQNIGMNLSIMPVIGVPIPFVSYGGTFLIVCCALLGVVQSVWVHRYTSPVQVDPTKITQTFIKKSPISSNF